MTVDPHLPSDVLEAFHGALSNRHARAVFHYFRCYSTEVASADDLGRFVCERDESATDENEVAVHLHHVTLPKLSDTGFVDYDPRSNTVRYREPEPIEAWLDHVLEEDAVPS